EPQIPQRRSSQLTALIIDFIGGHDDGFIGSTQDLNYGVIIIGDADDRIDDKNNGVSRLNGNLRLRGDEFGHTLGVGNPSAGVDDSEFAAIPLRIVGNPVSSDTRDVFDDGGTTTQDAIDEGRFSDIRSADDRHNG